LHSVSAVSDGLTTRQQEEEERKKEDEEEINDP